MSVSPLPIIPQPLNVKPLDGVFLLTMETPIIPEHEQKGYTPVGEMFRGWLESSLDHKLPSASDSTFAQAPAISFRLDEGDRHSEAYRLNITPDGIRASATSRAGLLHAMHTLRQLFPAEFEGGNGAVHLPVPLPAALIEDAPRFRWRGLSFDCCRHFIDKDYILRLLELLAYHKMNVFHWHLTEDQGWRLQIDRYPKLTEVGAWRGEERYGGFYTKEDVREVLAHAKQLGVLVIPEIEMPGHSTAAIAAYPELSCHGEPREVWNQWGVNKDIYCAGKESTFEILQGVLEEVIEIFPSPYIHIGGDEAPKDNWKACPHCQKRIEEEGLKDEKELQSWFIRRIGKFLESKERKLVGWDEIAEGGVPTGAILQHWAFPDHLKAALEAGHKVLLSHVDYAYMDFPYHRHEDGTTEPADKPDWMRPNPVSKVYAADPVPDWVAEDRRGQILGGEATMWLEHAPQERLDVQLWPRLGAMAELYWSATNRRDWEDFRERLLPHAGRLEAMGVNVFRGTGSGLEGA